MFDAKNVEIFFDTSVNLYKKCFFLVLSSRSSGMILIYAGLRGNRESKLFASAVFIFWGFKSKGYLPHVQWSRLERPMVPIER